MKKQILTAIMIVSAMSAMAQTDYLIIEKKDKTTLKFPIEDITRMRFEYENSLFGQPAEMVDLGLSVKWASWNMGASKPEEYGSYFYWGDPTGTADKANNANNEISGTANDIAHVQWGGEWRLPTLDEMQELVDNCTFKWTTRNGVSGGLFTSKKSGYTSRSIFIPAGGDSYGDSYRSRNEQGKTWCDEYFQKDGSNYGYMVYFDANQAYRNYGMGLGVKMPIRPVYGKKGSAAQATFTVTTGAVSNLTETSATVKGSVSAKNVSSQYCYGIYVAKSGTPSAGNYIKNEYGFTASNNQSMEFTVYDLTANTTYYYRAYVVSGDKAYYGDTKSFTTSSKQPSFSVTTGDASEITENSAKLTCTIVASNTSGTMELGFFVAENGTPSSTNGLYKISGNFSGDDTYSLWGTADELDANTTYRYRAYAYYDGKYYYGDTKSFTTESGKQPTTGSSNGHNWVDLGLPSGTRWATCNVGASTPQQSGSFYAWGETNTKSTFQPNNHKYWSSGNYNLPDEICGNRTYDAATASWGDTWRMPNYSQLSELCHQCTWSLTSMSGVSGYQVTGPNGNSIFMPIAGSYQLTTAGSRFNDNWFAYWSGTSSTLYYSNQKGKAFILQQSPTQSGTPSIYYNDYMCEYYCGHTIRAVLVN